MKTMTDMKMTAAEAKDSYGCMPAEASDAPRYPWGLSITLDNEALKKLGMDDLPKVDGELELTARVTVTAVSANSTQSGEERKSVTLQITKMALEGEVEKASASSMLYGS